jgi:ABC-type uncharacterized transport system involved in gliding motility auxiliary subunit
MKKSTLKSSAWGPGGLLVVGLLFVGVLLLANTLLRGAKIDLTADNVHTLSAGTERIVRNLKEPVNLYFFFSKETATEYPQIKNYGTHVQELLEELASQANGKLTLKVIDPKPFSEDEDRATELGVTSEQVNATGDRLYFGIAATNSTDGKDSIPVLDPKLEEQLEYDVVKLIHKVAAPRKPVVGWLSSLNMQADFDMQSGRPKPPWAVYGQVEQLYTVRPLTPQLTSIDDDLDVLVIVHPKNLPPAALYAIDQYAMRGGHILAFVDPNAQADQSANDPSNPMAAQGANRSSQLEPLLASWGVKFPADQVVVDLERGLTVQVRADSPPLQHIAILGFTNESMAKDVVVGQLDTVNMVTVGSLSPVDGSKLKFEPLVRTSKQAGVLPVERFAMLQEADSLRDGFRPTGDFVVAARVSGTATSAFAAGPPPGVTPKGETLKESSKPLNVVIVADTDLLSDLWWTVPRNFFGQTVYQPIANNGELVWNAIDNLSGSSDLISIRGRAAYSRPFDRVDALRREANDRFRATEQQLQEQLQSTEQRLSQLQTSQPGGNELLVSPDAMSEIEKFKREQVRIRKELRAVNANLEKDIRLLGLKIKLINVLVVPALVAIVGLLVWLWRRQRRRAITMLRSQGVAS